MIKATIATNKVTPEEYLRMERESDEKHEYLFGKIIPMGGASTDHNEIAGNLYFFIRSAMDESIYNIYQSDQRIYNGITQNYVYPDVVVVKGELEYADDMFDTLTNPLLVVEVASSSTMKKDCLEKFLAYRQANSFKEYLIAAQDEIHVQKFYQTDEGLCEIEDFTNLEESLYLKSVAVTLQVKDIYKKVKFK